MCNYNIYARTGTNQSEPLLPIYEDRLEFVISKWNTLQPHPTLQLITVTSSSVTLSGDEDDEICLDIFSDSQGMNLVESAQPAVSGHSITSATTTSSTYRHRERNQHTCKFSNSIGPCSHWWKLGHKSHIHDHIKKCHTYNYECSIYTTMRVSAANKNIIPSNKNPYPRSPHIQQIPESMGEALFWPSPLCQCLHLSQFNRHTCIRFLYPSHIPNPGCLLQTNGKHQIPVIHDWNNSPI